MQPIGLSLPPAPRASSSTSGCERPDFAGFRRGRIALLQRGRFFFVKARNAQAAGASAVLVFNEGQPGRRAPLEATLGVQSRIRIPVLGLSYAAGRALARGSPVVRVGVRRGLRARAPRT